MLSNALTESHAQNLFDARTENARSTLSIVYRHIFNLVIADRWYR